MEYLVRRYGARRIRPARTFIMGSANVTLYAVWVEKLYKITYFGNGNTGGTVPVDTNGYKKYASVKMAGNTGNMTKTGLVFAGWSETATDLRQQYLAGDSFSVLESKDYSWYAIWQDPGAFVCRRKNVFRRMYRNLST